MKNINTKKGFTIIEVVLVLAIAGLIFLMVFIALPNLQRSQRDTQRRNDYAALASNMVTYITNNGGKLPNLGTSDTLDFDASVYINENGQDADNQYYYQLKVVSEDKIDTVFTSSISGKAKTTLAAETQIPNKAKGDATGKVNTKKVTSVYVVVHADCSASFTDGTAKPKKTDSNDRHFAIYGALETGAYCQAE